MTWPVSQDYNEAIQNAQTCLADVELRAGQPLLSPLGLPMPRSGNFADVYQIDCPATGKRWAVKCFTREVPGLQERYSAIGKHLALSRPPFMVDFQYQVHGVRVRGQWYPILKMRWIEGLLLSDFVRDHCHKPAMMEKLADLWLRMAVRLGELQIAHGDLQHGNVMLVASQKDHALKLKLIDYDGMYIPALSRWPSGEFGHPAFQHPERARTGVYGPSIDRFSLLLIATALHALRTGGRSLWDRYDNSDNLLFRAADLAAPGQSALFKELRQLSDPGTRVLVDQLQRGCEGPLAHVPNLQDVLGPIQPAKDARAAPEPVVTAPNPGRKRGRVGAWAAALIGCLILGLAIALGLRSTSDHGDSSEPVSARANPPTAPSHDEGDVPASASPLPSKGEKKDEAAEELVRKAAPKAQEQEDPAPAEPAPPATAQPKPLLETAQPDRPPPAEAPKSSKGSPVAGKAEASRLAPTKPRSTSPAESRTRPAPAAPPRPAVDAGQFVKEWPRAGEVGRLKGHTGQVRRLALSPDGGRLLSVSTDGTVRVWDVAGQREVGSYQAPGGVNGNAAAFLPDGKRALASTENGGVSIWNIDSGQEERTLVGHKEKILHVAVSGDSKHALTCSAEDAVLLWNLDAGSAKRLKADEGGVESVAFSPDGRLAVAGTLGGQIILWEVVTGREISRFPAHVRNVTDLAFTADSRYLFSCGRDSAVRRWDVEQGQQVPALKASTTGVNALAIAPDGSYLLAAGTDGHLRGWDLRVPALGPRPLCDFVQEPPVWDVLFSDDGRHAFSAGADKDIHIWRLPHTTRGKTQFSTIDLTRKSPADLHFPDKRYYRHTTPVQLQAGTTYVVELLGDAGAPEPTLRIEDAKDNVLKVADRNASEERIVRIGFIPSASGNYRLVASSPLPGPLARFFLILTEDARR